MEEKRAVGEEKEKAKEEWWEETYADTGCEFSPRCLECPLPACRYDLPPKQAGVYFRALKLLPLLEHGRTRTVDQLAARCSTPFGIRGLCTAPPNPDSKTGQFSSTSSKTRPVARCHA